MKAFLYLLAIFHVSTAQFAIPLHSRLDQKLYSEIDPKNIIESVVDWSQLTRAARRTTERYGKLDRQTVLPKYDNKRRWIATNSLPSMMKKIALISDDETEKEIIGGKLPKSFLTSNLRTATTQIEKLPKSDSQETQIGDFQKGQAFAKLGMVRGSTFIRQSVPSSGSSKQNTTSRQQSRTAKLDSIKSKDGKLREKSTMKPKKFSSQRSTSTGGGTFLQDSISGQSDIEYYGQIQVGTPPQDFMIDFDTGSSDMWIKDKACKTNCGSGSNFEHAYYDHEQSSTSKSLDEPFEISYGVGGVSGKLYEDTVTISGNRVQGQAFAVCDVLSEDWNNDPADGVLGLAFKKIATSHKNPWFYNAVAQNKNLKNSYTPNSEMFSFSMGRFISQSQLASELFFGGQNSNKYEGEFTWVPLISKTYWQITLSKIFCKNENEEKSRVNIPSTTAIVDSGTSYIAAPAEQAKMFWDNVPNSEFRSGDGFYTFPCSQRVNMVLDFGGGIELSVNELDLNIGKVSVGSDRCVGAVFGGQTGGNWILGISFMKNYYTTFDFGSSRVGFAKPSYH